MSLDAIADRAHREGPLSGVRVLDLTRVVMGPLATQILGDQGADVILIEASGGDTNRVMGPWPHPQLSGIALNLLRNKRSVDIDLKTAEGQDFARRLVATCDVVVATMRPQALRKLGLDYPNVRQIKPDIVYCQAQGFPLQSDRAEEPAYDDVIQAACGVSDVMERVYGEPGLVPTIFADKVSGLVIAQAVTAALFHKQRTGEGQHVEVPMQQAVSAFMLTEHGSGAIAEPPIHQEGFPAAGYPRILSPERRPHRTLDGQIHMFPYQPKHYNALFKEAGLPGVSDDPRFVNKRATLENSDSLYRDVRKICLLRTTDQWLEFCRDAGIPSTKVYTIQDLVDELPFGEHPAAGRYRVIPAMANFSLTPTSVRRAAPLIGEHTREIAEEMQIVQPEIVES